MNWNFYLKTTETCNLNCKHCFTNGSNGPKIYWEHLKVINWLKEFRRLNPAKDDFAHLEFHGGEPFLAPVSQMQEVYDECKDLWENQSWGITTNLVFKLTDEHIKFIQGPLQGRIGTSWDPDIRFANPKQYDLWRKNVTTLLELGVQIKLFVSVTSGTLKIEPIDLLEWVRDLGVQELALERLTHNGSANKHPEIFPTNIEQDAWFLKMHQQSQEHDARHWFHNEFMETIYTKFDTGQTQIGTFCRDCEEKLFTLNASGTIGGCPNGAPEEWFGTIDDPIVDLLTSPQRVNNIACERARNPACYSCDVFDVCSGDCHQLSWQGNVCGAPKSLMRHLKNGTKNTHKVWMLTKA